MKRILSLLTALVLVLLPTLAMAQTATDYATYADPDGRFSFQYPSDWNLLAKSTVDAVIEKANSAGNTHLAQSAQFIKTQAELDDMLALLSADNQANISIYITSDITMSSVSSMLQYSDTFIEQVTTTLEGAEITIAPTVEVISGQETMVIEYTYLQNGQTFTGLQLAIIGGSNLYTFTFSCNINANEDYVHALSDIVSTITFH